MVRENGRMVAGLSPEDIGVPARASTFARWRRNPWSSRSRHASSWCARRAESVHAPTPPRPGPRPGLVEGDPALIEAISQHVIRHVGPIVTVLHEERSKFVHVDVHVVAPADDRPYYTLVTSSMSQRPMTTPPGHEAFAYGELVMKLPRWWPMSQQAWRNERHYWPIRLLRGLARFPHEHRTWLGWGHTIPNGPEATPFAKGTGLCCAVLEHVFEPLSLARLELPDRVVHFYSVIPIRRDEMEYKLRYGAEPLSVLLETTDVGDVIDPARPSAIVQHRCNEKRRRSTEG